MPSPKSSCKALDYYEKFRCIGSTCESNCCNSWVIFIDEDAYAKYQKLDEENGTNYFQHVTRRKDQPVISLTPEGYCPYLTENNLCDILKTHGESVFHVVCRQYPRYGRLLKHTNTLYLSCMLSCPQAMRLAIMRKKRLSFLDLGKVPPKFAQQIAYKSGDGVDAHNHVLDAIHQAFVDLGRDLKTSLNKRMAALLLLASQASQHNPLHNVDDALSLLQQTLGVKSNNFADIPDIPGDIGNQFKIFTLLASKIILIKTNTKDSPARKKFFAIIDQAFAGFGISSFEKVTDEHFARYVQGMTQLVAPYFDANPHVWENLLSHYLMTCDFPFTNNRAPLVNLVYLGILLLLCRGLFAGYALSHGKADDALFVHVFHMVFREIDHDPHSTDTLNAFVEEIMANSIGQLYTILAF